MGGANSWAGITLDESTGIAYIPTGSASYDFWGGNRSGENLFVIKNNELLTDLVSSKKAKLKIKSKPPSTR